MTIAASVICKKNGKDAVLSISDRMMTMGDIEYLGHHEKAYPFWSNRAICLSAGAIDVSRMIINTTNVKLTNEFISEIESVSETYADNYRRLRRSQAEDFYLSPLGLDTSTFIANQSTMNSEVVREITYKIQEYSIEVESLISGVDKSGAHIYKISHPGTKICFDHTGFVSIGTGAYHFQSVFASSSYDRNWPVEKVLLLAYIAKKKSQIAPGVGPETDIFVTTSDGTITANVSTIDHLEKAYNYYENTTKDIIDRTINMITFH